MAEKELRFKLGFQGGEEEVVEGHVDNGGCG